MRSSSFQECPWPSHLEQIGRQKFPCHAGHPACHEKPDCSDHHDYFARPNYYDFVSRPNNPDHHNQPGHSDYPGLLAYPHCADYADHSGYLEVTVLLGRTFPSFQISAFLTPIILRVPELTWKTFSSRLLITSFCTASQVL